MTSELSKFIHNGVYFGQSKHQCAHRDTGTKGQATVRSGGLCVRQYFKSTFRVVSQFLLYYLELISFTETQC